MMNINSVYFKILIFLTFFVLPGCYYDIEEELYGSSVCDTSAVTYSLSVKPIIDASCNSCHSTASAQGGIILDSHSALKGYADSGQLLGVIRHESGYSPMPKGGSKLSDCNIVTIEKWVAAGSPNN